MKKFCILTTQRSGSTWVMDSIQKSIPSNVVFGEPFLNYPAKSKDPWNEPHGNLVPPVRYFDWKKKSNAFFLTAPKLYLSFLELYAQKASVFGFKLMYNQLLKNPGLVRLLKQGNYEVLHLKRNNLLNVYISSQNMNKTKAHLRIDAIEMTKGLALLTIDPVKAHTYIKRTILKEKIIKNITKLSGINMKTVEYSRLAKNDKNEIKKLNDLIGEPINLFSAQGFQKLSRKKACDKITNYKEVISFLKNKKLNESYYMEAQEAECTD